MIATGRKLEYACPAAFLIPEGARFQEKEAAEVAARGTR
jgi:hypothetical protein